MERVIDPIDDILAAHSLKAPWEPLPDTGLANRIYATKDVVIRVAREHDEALRDAKTESIAAPIAYAAGVLTPQLIAYDDSRTLIDAPYTIWERVHGETLGLLAVDPSTVPNTWREVGRQMGRLHTQVTPFEDANNDLHAPSRNLRLRSLLEKALSSGLLAKDVADDISELIDQLQNAVHENISTCFLHSDIHDMNIMCTRDDKLLAVIDWGDAGWGDPTFDFAQIPLDAMSLVLEGYTEIAPEILPETLPELTIWDKIDRGLEWLCGQRSVEIPLDDYRQFLGRQG